MIKYIFYKLINNFYFKFFLERKSSLIWSFDSFRPYIAKSIFFDFSDETTHLGDRLFFLALFYEINNLGIEIQISDKDGFTKDLVKKILGLDLKCYSGKNKDITIFPSPSLLRFKNEYKNSLIIHFSDTNCRLKITEQLIKSFSNIFSLRLNSNSLLLSITENNQFSFSLKNGKYFLFNNYINSGGFRKFFVNEKKLYEKAISLKKKGYQVIHVGSEQDFSNDSHYYEFIDIDLRGKTTVIDLIDLIQCPNVFGVITFDNYLMHLAGLYKKTAYVLFRGRFLKKNRIHHLKYVNNTFFEDESKLIYL